MCRIVIVRKGEVDVDVTCWWKADQMILTLAERGIRNASRNDTRLPSKAQGSVDGRCARRKAQDRDLMYEVDERLAAMAKL